MGSFRSCNTSFSDRTGYQLLQAADFNQYFDLVSLTCIKRPDDTIVGFCGVLYNKIEMLFIHPDARGSGIGKALLLHALAQGINEVDVNEQNEQAVGFYLHQGFKIISRTETDGLGKPYPILHLRIA